MPMETASLQNKVILVTGASGEIGSAIVQSLARQGVRPIIHFSRDEKGAQFVLDQIQDQGWIVQADLSSLDGAQALWDKSVELAGQVHGLVNNAGIRSEVGLDADMDEWQASWRKEFQINFFAAVDLCKLAILHFKAHGGGRIVNISSRAGQRGYSAKSMAYGASKAALINLSKSIARSFGGDGITAVTIAPGWVNTQMAKDYVQVHGAEAALGEIPIRQMAELTEIADMVAFVMQPGNQSLSGGTIDINGGSYTR